MNSLIVDTKELLEIIAKKPLVLRYQELKRGLLNSEEFLRDIALLQGIHDIYDCKKSRTKENEMIQKILKKHLLLEEFLDVKDEILDYFNYLISIFDEFFSAF